MDISEQGGSPSKGCTSTQFFSITQIQSPKDTNKLNPQPYADWRFHPQGSIPPPDMIPWVHFHTTNSVLRILRKSLLWWHNASYPSTWRQRQKDGGPAGTLK